MKEIAAGTTCHTVIADCSILPLVCLLLAMLCACFGCSGPNGDASEVIMTFNIRYNNPGDGINAWPNRRDRVATLIRFHGADVVALQEAQKNQIDDLVKRLPGFSWYGVGRDDGREGGEFVPVFFRTGRYTLADSGTFWLSTTPETPGPPAWDAAITRIVTWVLLDDRVTRRQLFVFNAHFDHVGETARQESAKLLKARVEARRPAVPAVVLGDFNSEPSSAAYSVLTDGSASGAPLLVDAAGVASLSYGPAETFHGFEVGGEPPRRIDYIFLTEGIEVRRFGVLTDQEEGRYPSDHLPVLAQIVLDENEGG